LCLPKTPAENAAALLFSPWITPTPLVPLSTSGFGTACKNADALSPSNRSAFRFVTTAALATLNGTPAAPNVGATANVFAPVKLCAEPSRATFELSLASPNVPVATLDAFSPLSPAPDPAKLFAPFVSDTAPVYAPLNRPDGSVPLLRFAAF
jgi:hypothetical protein